MDPLSIVTSVPSLIGAAGNIVTLTYQLRNALRDSPLLLSSVIAECTTVRTSLSILQTVQSKLSQRTDLWTEEVKTTVGLAISGCALILSIIEEDIQMCLRAGEQPQDENAVKQTQVILSKDHLQELVSHLRGQQQALALLVRSLQSRDADEIRENLEDNHSIIDGIAKQGQRLYEGSLYYSPITQSASSTDASFKRSLISSTRFDFDEELLASQAYQRAIAYLQKVRVRQTEIQSNQGQTPMSADHDTGTVYTHPKTVDVESTIEFHVMSSIPMVDVANQSKITMSMKGENSFQLSNISSENDHISTSISPGNRNYGQLVNIKDWPFLPEIPKTDPLNLQSSDSNDDRVGPELNANRSSGESIDSTIRPNHVSRPQLIQGQPKFQPEPTIIPRKLTFFTCQEFDKRYSRMLDKQMLEHLEIIRAVAVGDPWIGKTAAIFRARSGRRLDEFWPTYFAQERHVPVEVGFDVTDLIVTDTAGAEDYDRARPLSYRGQHVVILGFSIGHPDSLDNVQEKWISEVLYFTEKLPIVLVGYKSDLRKDPKTIAYLAKRRERPVQYVDGLELASKIGAQVYVECSSLTGDGMEQLLLVAVKAALMHFAPYRRGQIGQALKVFGSVSKRSR